MSLVRSGQARRSYRCPLGALPIGVIGLILTTRRPTRGAVVTTVLSYVMATLIWSSVAYWAGSQGTGTERTMGDGGLGTLEFKIDGGGDRTALNIGESVYLSLTILSTVSPGGITPSNGAARLLVGLETVTVLVLILWVFGLSAWAGWPKDGPRVTPQQNYREDHPDEEVDECNRSHTVVLDCQPLKRQGPSWGVPSFGSVGCAACRNRPRLAPTRLANGLIHVRAQRRHRGFAEGTDGSSRERHALLRRRDGTSCPSPSRGQGPRGYAPVPAASRPDRVYELW